MGRRQNISPERDAQGRFTTTRSRSHTPRGQRRGGSQTRRRSHERQHRGDSQMRGTARRAPSPGHERPHQGHDAVHLATAIAQALAVALQHREQPLPIPSLERYTGKGDYNLYRLQFQNMANIRHWSYEQRGIMLSGHLAVDAVAVMIALPPHLRNDFDTLDNALRRRFGVPEKPASEYRRMLHECRQQQGQTLDEFALHVDDLVRRAHPDIDAAAQEPYKVETFVDGLADSMTASLVNFSAPATLEGALAAAMRCRRQPLQQAKAVRSAELAEARCTYCNKPNHTAEMCRARPRDQREDGAAELAPARDPVRHCTYCNRQGHLAAECRYRPRDGHNH